MALGSIVSGLLAALEPDRVEARAREMYDLPGSIEPDEEQFAQAQEQLVDAAVYIFNGELIELLDTIRREKEQTIDEENLDAVIRAEWAGDAQENAQSLVQDFQAYLEANRDEVEALAIFYMHPARRQTVTYEMIRQVLDKLKHDRPRLAPVRVWSAYALLDDYKGENPLAELTTLVSLIRRACGIDQTIAGYGETARRNFQNWIMRYHSGGEQKFNKEQMDWLHMIRDHIISSFHMERDDLETAPFDAQGGLGKMYQLFGSNMDSLIDELNGALAV